VRLAPWVLLLASNLFADSKNQVFSDFTIPLPIKPGDTLVLGIVGGWERWDAPQRCIRRVALSMRQMQLPGVWIETVENHKLFLAEELVQKAFDFDRSGKLEAGEKASARVIVYGQSLGGSATLRFCRWLNDIGIHVELALVVDSYGHDPYTVPPNVAVAVNLYQRDVGFILGAPKIVAQGPERTKILGNWQYHYTGKRISMPGEPWIRRYFMGSHLKMEYDPVPWERVTGLLVSALKSP
jgi:hypothetical protein